MKFLVEDDRDICGAYIVESTEEEKNDGKFHPMRIKGVFGKADYVNRNKRTYPYQMLKEQFDRFMKEEVETHSAFGEFEHPTEQRATDAEKREHAAIFINRVIPDEDNKQWYGEATIMRSDPVHGVPGTPFGDLLASHYYYSGNKNLCGFSTRGYGNLSDPDTDGVRRLTEYVLTAVDIVLSPSCGIMAEEVLESKEFMIDVHGRIVECAYKDYEKLLSKSTKTDILEKKREICKSAFDEFLKKIG